MRKPPSLRRPGESGSDDSDAHSDDGALNAVAAAVLPELLRLLNFDVTVPHGRPDAEQVGASEVKLV